MNPQVHELTFLTEQIFGGLLGLLAVGPISDWDLKRRTRNNGGIREAEMRLWVALYGGIRQSTRRGYHRSELTFSWQSPLSLW